MILTKPLPTLTRLLALLPAFSHAWLPSFDNALSALRGVNLGSLFIIENWMTPTVMSSWSCNAASEFDCVSSLSSQSDANAKWAEHWSSFVSPDDFSRMRDYGLNTVRIPVGYWFLESLVDRKSEHFPQGGEQYLDQVVEWARDAGLYTVIVLHGAPGAQATDAFTGQLNPNPGFYNDYNYERAAEWLEWMTQKIHTDDRYSQVGMLQLVNEPERIKDARYPNAKANAASMIKHYYPKAWSRIRAREDELSIPDDRRIHIQMMDAKWGSGNPAAYLPDTRFAAYDDHHYIKYVGLPNKKSAYIQEACTTDRSGDDDSPVFVGEWSLSVNSTIEGTNKWLPQNDIDFYRRFWAAQVMNYERTAGGWVFWSWKTTGLNDARWDYQLAVEMGIIDRDPENAYGIGAC